MSSFRCALFALAFLTFGRSIVSVRDLEVKAGTFLEISCDAPSVGKPQVVTWEDSRGEFLARGSILRKTVSEVDDGAIYVCRRRHFHPFRMSVARTRFTVFSRGHRFVNDAPKTVEDNNVTLGPEYLENNPRKTIFAVAGSVVVLKCVIHRSSAAFGVIWSRNGEELPKHFTTNYRTLSTLMLQKIKANDSGVYRCYVAAAIRQLRLQVVSEEEALTVFPSALTIRSGPAEFHCSVHIRNATAFHLRWNFLPFGSSKPAPLPPNVKAEADITNTTLFLVISRPQTENSGIYTCRLPSMQQFSRNVSLRVLSPQRLIIRPLRLSACAGQGSVSALCWVQGGTAAAFWRELSTETARISMRQRTVLGHRSQMIIARPTAAMNGRRFQCHSPEISRKWWRTISLHVGPPCNACVCPPNEMECKKWRGEGPKSRCILRHWLCDGEDDCGNGWDERLPLCIEKVMQRDHCVGRFFGCTDGKRIPRGFWCDGEKDCPDGSDELFCAAPAVIFPNKKMTLRTRLGHRLVLNCSAIGVPPPFITWRFNWGCLNTELQPRCSCDAQKGGDGQSLQFLSFCSLEIAKAPKEAAGIYNCEAQSMSSRQISPDMVVT